MQPSDLRVPIAPTKKCFTQQLHIKGCLPSLPQLVGCHVVLKISTPKKERIFSMQGRGACSLIFFWLSILNLLYVFNQKSKLSSICIFVLLVTRVFKWDPFEYVWTSIYYFVKSKLMKLGMSDGQSRKFQKLKLNVSCALVRNSMTRRIIVWLHG